MQVIVRRQFETGDDARRLTMDAIEELTALLQREGCAEAVLKWQGSEMPLVLELPPTSTMRMRVIAEVDKRLAKRMDLNRMAKGKEPFEPEKWMTLEQLAHYRGTGDMNWRHYGTYEDRRYGLD